MNDSHPSPAPSWTHVWAVALVVVTLFIVLRDDPHRPKPLSGSAFSPAGQPPTAPVGVERVPAPVVTPGVMSKSPVVTPLQYPVASQATVLAAYWTAAHQLPPVNDLAITPDGTVWAATENGLAGIRGDEMMLVSGDTKAFPAEQATALAHDGTSLWIGTFRGLYRSSDGQTFQAYSLEQGLAHSMIWSLHWDGFLLWIGTQKGFSFLTPEGSLHSVTRAISNNGLADNWIGSILMHERYVVVGTGEGLSLWDTGVIAANPASWRTMTMFDGDLPHDWVFSLAVHQGRIWAGTPLGAAFLESSCASIFSGQPGRWQTVSAGDGLPGERVNVVLSSDQDLWLGTNGGLARWRDGKIHSVRVVDGLMSANVRSLAAIGTTLWVGTEAGVQALRTDLLPKP